MTKLPLVMIRSWNNCAQTHMSITNWGQFYLYGVICIYTSPELRKNTPRSCSEHGELNIQLSLTSLWIVQSALFPKHFAESVLFASVLYTTAASRLESLVEWQSTEKWATIWEVCHPKGGFGARHFLVTRPKEEVQTSERWPSAVIKLSIFSFL